MAKCYCILIVSHHRKYKVRQREGVVNELAAVAVVVVLLILPHVGASDGCCSPTASRR